MKHLRKPGNKALTPNIGLALAKTGIQRGYEALCPSLVAPICASMVCGKKPQKIKTDDVVCVWMRQPGDSGPQLGSLY